MGATPSVSFNAIVPRITGRPKTISAKWQREEHPRTLAPLVLGYKEEPDIEPIDEDERVLCYQLADEWHEEGFRCFKVLDLNIPGDGAAQHQFPNTYNRWQNVVKSIRYQIHPR